jgi:hypothetical protein
VLTWGVVLMCVVVVGASRLCANWYLRTYTAHEPIGTAAARRRLRRDLLFKHGLECHCSACKAAGLGMGEGGGFSSGGDSESSITLHHKGGNEQDIGITLHIKHASVDSNTLVVGGGGGGRDIPEAVRGMCRTPLLLWVSEEHPLFTMVMVMVVMPLAVEAGVASWFHARSRRYTSHMTSLLQAQLKAKQLDATTSVSVAITQPSVVGRSGAKRRRYAPQSTWANINAEVPTSRKQPKSPLVTESLVASKPSAHPPQRSPAPPPTTDQWGRARGLKLFRQLLLAQTIYTHSHLVSLVLVGLVLECMYIIALLQ